MTPGENNIKNLAGGESTSEANNEGAKRLSQTAGGLGGAVSPPMGVRGAAPKFFAYFDCNARILVHSET